MLGLLSAIHKFSTCSSVCKQNLILSLPPQWPLVPFLMAVLCIHLTLGPPSSEEDALRICRSDLISTSTWLCTVCVKMQFLGHQVCLRGLRKGPLGAQPWGQKHGHDFLAFPQPWSVTHNISVCGAYLLTTADTVPGVSERERTENYPPVVNISWLCHLPMLFVSNVALVNIII